MARFCTHDQLYHGEVDSAMSAPNMVVPLVWIPQLQAWLVDTSRLLGTQVTPPGTCEDFVWLENKNDHKNIMKTFMANATNQYESGFCNSNCQEMAFNNQTSYRGESVFGANISNNGSLLYVNAMNELNKYSSTWAMPWTYNDRVLDKENFYSEASSSRFNLSNIHLQIPRNVFEGVQPHGLGIGHGHVPRTEEMKGEFCTCQHQLGIPQLGQHMTKVYGDELFEPTDSSSLGNHMVDNKYYMNNLENMVPFLRQHATETSYSQLLWSDEQNNSNYNVILDYVKKMKKLPSTKDLGEKLGYAISIDGQQEYCLPGPEELGEELGFVKTMDEYDTKTFTTNLMGKLVKEEDEHKGYKRWTEIMDS